MMQDRSPVQRCVRVCFAVLACVLPLLAGCGVAPPTTTTPTPVQTPVVAGAIDGRWSFQPTLLGYNVSGGTSALIGGPGTLQFHGALSTKGSAVTAVGVLTPGQPGQPSSGVGGLLNLSCISPQSVTLHGTLSSTRHLSLTSDPVLGGLLTLDADVPADPHGAAAATATLTGSCPASSTILVGSLYEPISGNYTGVLQVADVTTRSLINQGTATATVTETAPDSFGKSVVSGSLTLALPTCTANIALNEVRYGGAMYNVSQQSLPIPGSSTAFPLIAVIGRQDGKQAVATSIGLGTDCKPEGLTGLHTDMNALMSK